MLRSPPSTASAPAPLRSPEPSSSNNESSAVQAQLSSALGGQKSPALPLASASTRRTEAPSLDAVRSGSVMRRGHRGVSTDSDFGSQTESAVGTFQDRARRRPSAGMRGVVGAALRHIERQGGDLGPNDRGQAGPYAVWTTGGGSSLLDPAGDWDTSDFRAHHSDRTGSSAADRVRAGRNIPYESVDAYDFTFERLDAQGRAVEGTAHGLPMMVPVQSKVLDIQPTFEGSGGYGKFILLEYIDGDLAGERVEVHHLDTVGDFSVGQILAGGSTFGSQGASGDGRYDYAARIDIVGTPQAVALFVRANQSGRFQTDTARQPSSPSQSDPPATPPPVAPGQLTAAPSLSDV